MFDNASGDVEKVRKKGKSLDPPVRVKGFIEHAGTLRGPFALDPMPDAFGAISSG
jgi:hypothetical protein